MLFLIWIYFSNVHLLLHIRCNAYNQFHFSYEFSPEACRLQNIIDRLCIRCCVFPAVLYGMINELGLQISLLIYFNAWCMTKRPDSLNPYIYISEWINNFKTEMCQGSKYTCKIWWTSLPKHFEKAQESDYLHKSNQFKMLTNKCISVQVL